VTISDNTSTALTKNLSLYNMVGGRRTAHAHFPQLRRLSSAATAELGVTARDELALLLAEVSSYLSSLPARQKKEFDTAWGIDAVEALAAIQHGEYDNNVKEVYGSMRL
jgi:DNA-binding SARP family transcriptional activator